MKVEMELPMDFSGRTVVVQQILTDDPAPCRTDGDKCPTEAHWAVFSCEPGEDPGAIAMTACNKHVCDLLWLMTQPVSVLTKRTRFRMWRQQRRTQRVQRGA